MEDTPWLGILVYAIIILLYYVFNLLVSCLREYKRQYASKLQTFKRQELLIQARPYLEPYTDIWKYQKLTNKKLSAELKVRVITIKDEGITFTVKGYESESLDEVWNIILENFDNNITYASLVMLIKQESRTIRKPLIFNEKKNLPKVRKVKNADKIDINNCSEMQLTALAGINVVQAKRIVAKRDSIKGFKSKEEFFDFMKLKTHFQNQLSERIIIKKIKIRKPIKLTKERIIDI